MAEETPPSFSDFSFSSIGKNSLLKRLSMPVPLAQTSAEVPEDITQELDDDIDDDDNNNNNDDDNDVYIDTDSRTFAAEDPDMPKLLARIGDAPVSFNNNITRPTSLDRPESPPSHVPSQQLPRIDTISQQSTAGSSSSLANSSNLHSHSTDDERKQHMRTDGPSATNFIAGPGPTELTTSSVVCTFNSSLLASSGLPTPPSSGGTKDALLSGSSISAPSAGHSIDPVRLASFTSIQSSSTPLTEFLNEERAAWGEVWEIKQTLSHPGREIPFSLDMHPTSTSAAGIPSRTETTQKVPTHSSSSPKQRNQAHTSDAPVQASGVPPVSHSDQPQAADAKNLPSSSPDEPIRPNGVGASATVRATSLSASASIASRPSERVASNAIVETASSKPVDNLTSSNANARIVNQPFQPVRSSNTAERRLDESKELSNVRNTPQSIESRTIPEHNAQLPSERVPDVVPPTPLSPALPFPPIYRYVDSRDNTSNASLVPSKRRVSTTPSLRHQDASGSSSSALNKQLTKRKSSTVSEDKDPNQATKRHKREDDGSSKGSGLITPVRETQSVPKKESTSFLPPTPTSSGPRHILTDATSSVNRKRSLSNALKVEDEKDKKISFPIDSRPLKKVKEEDVEYKAVIKEEEEELTLENLGAVKYPTVEEPARQLVTRVSAPHPQPNLNGVTQATSVISTIPGSHLRNVASGGENAKDLSRPISNLPRPAGLSQQTTEPPVAYPTSINQVDAGLSEERRRRPVLAGDAAPYRRRQDSLRHRSPSANFRQRRAAPIRSPSRDSTISERQRSRNSSGDRRSGGERGRSREWQTQPRNRHSPPPHLNRSPPYNGDSYRPSHPQFQNSRRIEIYRVNGNRERTPPRFERERQRSYQSRSRSPVASRGRSPSYRYSRSPRSRSRGRYNSLSPSRPSGIPSNASFPSREQHNNSRDTFVRPSVQDSTRPVYRGVNTPSPEDSFIHQPLQPPPRPSASLCAGNSTGQEEVRSQPDQVTARSQPSSRQINPPSRQITPTHERSRSSRDSPPANDGTGRRAVAECRSARMDGPLVERRYQASSSAQLNDDNWITNRGQGRPGERFLRNVSPNDLRSEANNRSGSCQGQRTSRPSSSYTSDAGPAPTVSQDYANRPSAIDPGRSNSENHPGSYTYPMSIRNTDSELENRSRTSGGLSPRDIAHAKGDNFTSDNSPSNRRVEVRHPQDYRSVTSYTIPVDSTISAAPPLSTSSSKPRPPVAVPQLRDHPPDRAQHQDELPSLMNRIVPLGVTIEQVRHMKPETNAPSSIHPSRDSSRVKERQRDLPRRSQRTSTVDESGASGNSSLSARLALADEVHLEQPAQDPLQRDLTKRERVRLRREQDEKRQNASTRASPPSLASRLENPLPQKPVSHTAPSGSSNGRATHQGNRGTPSRGGSSLFSRMSDRTRPSEQLGHGTSRGRGRGRGAATIRSQTGARARESFSPGKPTLEDRLNLPHERD